MLTSRFGLCLGNECVSADHRSRTLQCITCTLCFLLTCLLMCSWAYVHVGVRLLVDSVHNTLVLEQKRKDPSYAHALQVSMFSTLAQSDLMQCLTVAEALINT